MNIEVGKQYITADGNIVLVLYNLKDCNYYNQNNKRAIYNKDGKYLQYINSNRDLICEII